jgi:sugar phosphate isomerase/epimerase
MILTLSARCMKSLLVPTGRSKRPQLDLLDLPRFARETLGLSGVNFSTDLLAGADRARLEAIRERADKASCASLLLIEPEALAVSGRDATKAQAAQQRARRVVEAAQLLGCSAAAIKVAASDDDAALTATAAALKPVVERAEKLDINLLISPHDGLTQRPERVTELLKKVGGFRIGTFPDLQVAAQSDDPVGYLHRLTPYASAVCAVTVKLLDPAQPKAAAKADAKNKKKSATPATPANGRPSGEEVEDDDDAVTAEVSDADEEGEEELNDAEFDELERMIDDVMDEEEDDTPQIIACRHEPYELLPLVSAITNVGFDGPLSLEYRGTGDLTEALLKTRDTFIALVGEARRTGG